MIYKCLDLAITQLHKGEKAIIKCPPHLAFGNKPETSPLT
jgi:hypothetical protein